MKFLLLKVLLPLVVLFAGLGYAAYMVESRPQPPKVERPQVAALVEVEEAEKGDRRVTVRGVGRVGPARQAVLAAEVSGRVVEVHDGLAVGGLLAAGEVAVRIDDEDYKLAVAQRRAAVTQARVELQVEAGRRRVAKQEWTRLAGDIETTEQGEALALRKPYQALAKANVSSARAALAAAQRQVAKAEVTVPFNAYVRAETVEPGMLAGPTSQLAQLVGTDAFWIEAAVPLDRLSWIDIPGINGFEGAYGSTVRVRQQAGDDVFTERTGRTLRLLNELDALGVQARVLVEVRDPLLLADDAGPGMPLLLNAFVDLEFEGRSLQGVVRVPRVALRDGDKVWVATADDTLAIRQVAVVWRDEQEVLVDSGLAEGERVITSRLVNAADGMSVRVAGAEAPRAGSADAAEADAGPADQREAERE